MSFYELLSLLVAGLSLTVAALAYRYSVKSAKENRRISQEIADKHSFQLEVIERNKASEKYVKVLAEVRFELEKVVNELYYPASEANRIIGEVFDSYDRLVPHGTPYLRHALNNCIRIVYASYDSELAYQTGQNLVSRLQCFRYKEDNPGILYKKRSVWLNFFRSNPNYFPEEKLQNSLGFSKNIKVIYDRIDRDKESELFTKVLSHASKYIELHKKHKPKLVELKNKLESAKKENALEWFDIERVDILGQKFRRTQGDINRLEAFSLLDIEGFDKYPVHEGVGFSLYAASILYIVSMYSSWGSRYR